MLYHALLAQAHSSSNLTAQLSLKVFKEVLSEMLPYNVLINRIILKTQKTLCTAEKPEALNERLVMQQTFWVEIQLHCIETQL